ncbi:hypothetical protein E2562_005679 [Oryza meyeriana var. granulata]|uniref:Glycosyl transferase CAP10 domain-containing protein n=1 Tax=Oryza meyeriana var. granulata TaxID=110450 RepID=A0A6G1F4D9_9ORYZ|nr:hypothetical protein E2562_005679 [Oryza meyeriana var. granulata]
MTRSSAHRVLPPQEQKPSRGSRRPDRRKKRTTLGSDRVNEKAEKGREIRAGGDGCGSRHRPGRPAVAILTATQTSSIPANPTAPPPPRPTYSISCSAPPLPRDPAVPSNISRTLYLALSSPPTCPSVPDPQPIPPTATNSTCPAYFRFIHEDLHPWRAAGGITRAMLGRARATANFRLVVLRGRAYVERIAPAFQTRDLFTIWGILQLLRRYPGRVPDLELMFDCVDWPVVRADEYQGENATVMPPLFRYCGDDETLDVVFPDWSFWGWPEINIKPWDALQKDLDIGNKRVKWVDREPYAYWKGNPDVATNRQELVQDLHRRISMLLRFKPTKPPEGVEICPESLACQGIGREKKFMEDSMVKSANDAGPCDLPPPFSPEEFKELQQRKEKSMKLVETWEQKASKT